VGHNKRPNYHEGDPAKQTPAAPSPNKQPDSEARDKQSNTKHQPTERKYWGMTKFEWIMGVLTLAALIVAGLTGAIFWKQLGAMKTDQRAWITLTPPAVAQISKDAADGVTMAVPVTVVNTGKTPAKHLFTEIAILRVANGREPNFSYTEVPVQRTITAVLFPNSPFTIPITLSDPTLPNGQTKILSPAEYQRLTDGTDYMVLYAKSSYTDIFGIGHWYHYCIFWTQSTKPVPITSRACTEYNDVDNNLERTTDPERISP
jgi:hypothetical protein